MQKLIESCETESQGTNANRVPVKFLIREETESQGTHANRVPVKFLIREVTPKQQQVQLKLHSPVYIYTEKLDGATKDSC